MTTRFLSILTLALALSTAALAQDGGGQGGPPPGPPPGMGFGMRPGGGLPSAGMLLRRTDVVDDLQLTDSQKTQIHVILDAMRPQGGPGGPGGGPGGDGGPMAGPPPGGGGDGPPDGGPGGPGGGGPGGGGPGGPPPGDDQGGPPPDANGQQRGAGGPGGPGGPGGRGGFDAAMKQADAKLNAVLTDAQKARLHEIAIQLAGNSAITDGSVQTSLSLTATQKAKIKNLLAKQREAGRAIFEKVDNGDINRDDVPALMKKNNEILKTELGKVLTDAQRDKLKTLAGKPFKASAEDEHN